MPHHKCQACRIRTHDRDTGVDGEADSCPACGGPLEPVGDLSEIVGFQAGNARPAVAESPARRRLLDRIDEARAEAAREHRAHDAERWLDDGGGNFGGTLDRAVLTNRSEQ